MFFVVYELKKRIGERVSIKTLPSKAPKRKHNMGIQK